jgi:thiamine transporter
MRLDIRVLTHVALAVALSAVLSLVVLWRFPQGGMVTLGSMVPIFLIAIHYGPKVGILAGVLLGLVTMILDPFFVHPVQIFMDYIFAFGAIGFAGFFRGNKLLATLLGGVGRFTGHFLSGVIFFGMFAPEGMNPWFYSAIVNGTYLGIETGIAAVIILVLPIQRIFSAGGQYHGGR